MVNLRRTQTYQFGKRLERTIRTTIKRLFGDEAWKRTDYSAWLTKYGHINDEARSRIISEIAHVVDWPKISIVVPVYNPNIDWLNEAIESVKKQFYPNWELCLVDDCSSNEEVHDFLRNKAAEEERIKIVLRDTNGHISAASNSGVAASTGEWITFLDQDDLLTEDALYHVARTISAYPLAQFIYSDEDKIDNGRRFDPYFKSDWNIELLRGQNMVCHLAIYRSDRLRAIGGLRLGFEGAQDHDLVLRYAEHLKNDEIKHITRVLYHWRSHSLSTASGVATKDYASSAGQKAVSEHLQRLGIDAQVEITAPGRYRVHYALPQDLPKVSMIIPTRNGLALIKQCVDSILDKTTYTNYEILIVDNNSDDPATLDYFASLKEHQHIRVIRDERPFNYSSLNNNAVQVADGDYIAFINNDIEVISPDWLSEMMSFAVQADVGAVGARLWYPDDTLQHGGVVLGIHGVAGHAHKMISKKSAGHCGRAVLAQSFSAVTAACLVIRKDIFDSVGGFDEDNLSIVFNDVDLCLKVQSSGLRNVWTPYAEMYHHESATRGAEDTAEKKKRAKNEVVYMQKRWAEVIKRDPAYNPNLTLAHEDFSYAWPPRIDV